MAISKEQIIHWITSYAAVVHENKELLTQLDSEIGDADHGASMDRGFQAVAQKMPTVAEQGFPGVVVEEHIALQGPAGLPNDVVRRAHEASRAAMEAQETRQRLAALAVVPMVTTPGSWPAYFAAENAKWRDMIRARNIRVQ